MRVLLISIVYEPDMVSTSTVAAGLARGLQGLGHDVTVLTSVPHFNPPPGVTTPRRWPPVRITTEHGVRVLRCYSPPKSARARARLPQLILLHLAMIYATLRHARRQDATIVISPPLTFAVVGFLARLIGGGVMVYNVQELWPDVPRDLGVITNPHVLGLLRWFERTIYRQSDAVAAIGQRFAAEVRARAATSTVATIPNFVDTGFISPAPKDNRLSREWGISDRSVALYAGNIGLTQDFETLLAAARLLAPDIDVVIVGGGAGRNDLEKSLSAEDAPPNVQLEAFVPKERVSDLYASADVLVVPLKDGYDKTTTPSKVFSAMAAGRPVIACANLGTDLADVILDSHAGLVVPPGDAPALADGIRRLIEANGAPLWDPQRVAATVADHSPGVIARRYDELLRELVSRRRT